MSKPLFDLKEMQLQNLKNDIADKYVPNVEYTKLETDFKCMEIYTKEIVDSSNKNEMMHEDERKQLKEYIAKQGEELGKEREETLKLTAENEKLYNAIKSLAPIVVWYKACIKPEDLSFSDLEMLEKMAKDARKKKELPEAVGNFAKWFSPMLKAWMDKKLKTN